MANRIIQRKAKIKFHVNVKQGVRL